MSFLARFLGWALLLALPAWAFGDAYRAGLARALESVLAFLGRRLDLQRVDALAPMDLALFAALVLASDAWSWPRRARALLAGGLGLIAVQLAAWTLYLMTLMAAARNAAEGPPAAESLWQAVLGAAAWLAAVAAWLLGPGRDVLEAATRPAPAASRSPAPKRAS